jgi:hypothetical protein
MATEQKKAVQPKKPGLIETGLTFMGKKMVLIPDGKSDEIAARELRRISQVHLSHFRMIHAAFDRAK